VGVLRLAPPPGSKGPISQACKLTSVYTVADFTSDFVYALSINYMYTSGAKPKAAYGGCFLQTCIRV